MSRATPTHRDRYAARRAERGHLVGAKQISGQSAASVPGAVLFGFLLIASAVHPARAETHCVIPEALALRDMVLPAARQAVVTDHRLVVLTFGGVRTAGAEAEAQGSTYPARLEAELRAALPGTQVTVVNEPPPGKTSADVPASLPGLIAKTGANLVIWGPGSRDMAAKVEPGAFLNAINRGIEAARQAGSDMILLDTTFIPAPARMAITEVYRDKLRSAAAADHVPLLARHDLMRRWSEDGTLNLAARDQAEQELVARRLFSCVARGLAEPIAAAVR